MGGVGFDVFVSYAHADRVDGVNPRRRSVLDVVAGLRAAGLVVFFDEDEIGSWESISDRIRVSLAGSKALLAWYSATYPTRRACVAELTAALSTQAGRGEGSVHRVLVVNPESSSGHVVEPRLVDQLHHRAPVPGDSAGVAELVSAVVAQVEQFDGTFGDMSALTPRWIPRERLGAARFVGRQRVLWQLHQRLASVDSMTSAAVGGPARVAVVHGVGGQGKTVLAEEYALRFGSYWPGGVFWLSASEPDRPIEARHPRLQQDEFTKIAARLGVNTKDQTPDEMEGALASRLAEEGLPFLWVVDDLPEGLDYDEIADWFAPHTLGATLITTRWARYADLNVGAVDLDRLDTYDGVELLREHLDDVDQAAAERLVETVGGHAQAIDVAGGYLAQPGAPTLQDYITDLADPDQDALKVAADPYFGHQLSAGHAVSIATTLLRSIKHPLLGIDGEALLDLAAVLDDSVFPFGFAVMVAQTTTGSDHGAAQQATTRGFAIARNLALARQVSGDHEPLISVHTLVSYVHRRHHPGTSFAHTRTATIGALANTLANLDATHTSETSRDVMLARHLTQQPIRTVAHAELVGHIANYDRTIGRYNDARNGYERQHQSWPTVVSITDPRPIRTLRHLGWCLLLTGETSDARDRYREALNRAHDRTDLGPTFIPVLQTELGAIERALGSLAEAVTLGEQGLAAFEVLDPNALSTIAAGSNLAQSYQAAGRTSEARPLYEQAYQQRREQLGDTHPDTLTSLSNLAYLLTELEDQDALTALAEELRARGVLNDSDDT